MSKGIPTSKKQAADGSFYRQLVQPVDDLQVAGWSPGDVEKGDAQTEVHILFTMHDIPALYAAYKLGRGVPMSAMRFKSRAAVDSLIEALIEHRDEVWPASAEERNR